MKLNPFAICLIILCTSMAGWADKIFHGYINADGCLVERFINPDPSKIPAKAGHTIRTDVPEWALALDGATNQVTVFRSNQWTTIERTIYKNATTNTLLLDYERKTTGMIKTVNGLIGEYGLGPFPYVPYPGMESDIQSALVTAQGLALNDSNKLKNIQTTAGSFRLIMEGLRGVQKALYAQFTMYLPTFSQEVNPP